MAQSYLAIASAKFWTKYNNIDIEVPDILLGMYTFENQIHNFRYNFADGVIPPAHLPCMFIDVNVIS